MNKTLIVGLLGLLLISCAPNMEQTEQQAMTNTQDSTDQILQPVVSPQEVDALDGDVQAVENAFG